MLTFGLEKEYFVANSDGELTVVPQYMPHDDCGILAEARGNPCDSVVNAVYSLMAEEYRIKKQAKEKYKLTLLEYPLMTVPRDLKIEASREFEKSLTKYQNLYGYTRHLHKQSQHTAGIHVSFVATKSRTEFVQCTAKKQHAHSFTVPYLIDYAQIVRYLDEAFKKEIKATKRRPGFYEIKDDGRFEYRSLPNNVPLDTIITVLLDMVETLRPAR